MTMKNLTARTTAHAQALEAAMEFSPGGQQAVADFHERLDAANETITAMQLTIDGMNEQHSAVVAELDAEKQAHAATQAALEAATKTQE